MSVLEQLRTKTPNERQEWSTEAFSILCKDKATALELTKLQDLFRRLNWSKAMAAALETVISHYRSLLAEIEKPAPSLADTAKLSADLEIIRREWDEKVREYEKKIYELDKAINWQNSTRFRHEQQVGELAGLRQTFAPLFGVGAEWGRPVMSGGLLDDQLRLILKEEEAGR